MSAPRFTISTDRFSRRCGVYSVLQSIHAALPLPDMPNAKAPMILYQANHYDHWRFCEARIQFLCPGSIALSATNFDIKSCQVCNSSLILLMVILIV